METPIVNLHFTEEAHPVGDHMIESRYEDFLYNARLHGEWNTFTCNESVVNRCRIGHAEGEIILRLFWIDQELIVDEEGNLEEWPDGFCETHLKLLLRLIDAGDIVRDRHSECPDCADHA